MCHAVGKNVHILGCLGIRNTLDLDQAGAGGGVALATGVADVTTPMIFLSALSRVPL